jgi:exosome complex component RRP41
MDGNMTREELEYGLDMAFKAAHEVADLQKDALLRKYTNKKKEASE